MAVKKIKRKKLNFIGSSKNNFEYYKTGAYAGALVGGLVGLIVRKRVLLSIVIGGLVGGYINSEIHKGNIGSSLKSKIKKDE